MINILGWIVISDAIFSLSPYTPNNHQSIWLEGGRWLRLGIGVYLAIYKG